MPQENIISDLTGTVNSIHTPIQLIALVVLLVTVCIIFYIYTKYNINKDVKVRRDLRDKEQEVQNYDIRSLREWQAAHTYEHEKIMSRFEKLENKVDDIQRITIRIDTNLDVFQKFILDEWSNK